MKHLKKNQKKKIVNLIKFLKIVHIVFNANGVIGRILTYFRKFWKCVQIWSFTLIMIDIYYLLYSRGFKVNLSIFYACKIHLFRPFVIKNFILLN